jgi:STE24 endopeptidase
MSWDPAPAPSVQGDEPFSGLEVERARRYHRPLNNGFVADLALGLGLLGALAFSPLGHWLYRPVRSWPWWAATLAFTAMIVLVAALVRMPLAFWRGYLHEHEWGFSTQSVGGWATDRAKGLGMALVLTSSLLAGFVGLARVVPSAWPILVGGAFAGFVLVMSFVSPLILEPIFNRFRPLEDSALTAEIRAVSERAGVPVRDVLVADASRRTRKENAYVSGLGRTRRVVVFDTLLAREDRPGLLLVVAHELGHRRLRHVAKGTALGMAGAFAAVIGLWAVLQDETLLRAAGATGAGDPRVVPLVLLTGMVLQLLASPFESAVSRRWESVADRFSLATTQDAAVFERSFHDLAVANLSDLRPPRWLYLMAYSHPTPPERIEAARAWTRGPATKAASAG